MNKQFISTLIAFVFITTAVFAQNGPGPRYNQRMRQLRQLEQLRLVEILDLDEETSARFFARRKEHFDNIEKLQAEKNQILNELAQKIENNEKVNSKEYRAKLQKIERNLLEERIKFYNSLDDILTNEQIAKLLVFQSRFRKEIMRSMMKNKKQSLQNGN